MGVPVALVYLGFIGDDQISPGNQFSDEAAWQAAFREHVADCFPPSMLEAAVATSRAPFWLLPRSLHVIRPSQPRERRRGLGASEPLPHRPSLRQVGRGGKKASSCARLFSGTRCICSAAGCRYQCSGGLGLLSQTGASDLTGGGEAQ
jgi:hypothetical protein